MSTMKRRSACPTDAAGKDPANSSGGQDPQSNMSFESKLELIDQEIRTLHQFCVVKGYNPWQVERAAEPLLGGVRTAQRRRWGLLALKVLLVVVLAYLLFRYDPVYKLICAYGRLATLQVLPVWDWSSLYGKECLVDNPYYLNIKLTEEDCELCENLEGITRVANLSHPVMSEDFLKRDIPMIVTDGMNGWPAKQQFSIKFLHDLYTTEESLKEILPCMFASNVRIKYGNPRALLSKASRGEISNWYAHWENCEKHAAKALRQFYHRPYFLAPMVEMAESNWVFVASQYKGKKHKPADIALPLMWMAQLKGETKVTLTPRSPCNVTCPVLYNTLHEGEILVLTDLMWLLDYLPVGTGETIAIGAGGFFD